VTKFNEAIADYREVLNREPHNSKYRNSLTQALINSGKIKEAMKGKVLYSSANKLVFFEDCGPLPRHSPIF